VTRAILLSCLLAPGDLFSERGKDDRKIVKAVGTISSSVQGTHSSPRRVLYTFTRIERERERESSFVACKLGLTTRVHLQCCVLFRSQPDMHVVAGKHRYQVAVAVRKMDTVHTQVQVQSRFEY
jgi:hypothetical protein